MNWLHPAMGCGAVVSVAIATARATPDRHDDADAAIQAALAAVAEQCPESYPRVAPRLPVPGGFSGKSDAELLGMLDVWNPALRAAVVDELGGRGMQALPVLVEALSSDHAAHRLGALDALGRMAQHQLRNWQEFRPDETDPRTAQESIDIILGVAAAPGGAPAPFTSDARLAFARAITMAESDAGNGELALWAAR